MIRKRMRFYGWVQGVGFRYRAYYAASQCGVTGWVRNCADESVEMEVQGEESAIDEMLRRIEQGRYLRIENFTASSIPCISESGFSILDDA